MGSGRIWKRKECKDGKDMGNERYKKRKILGREGYGEMEDMEGMDIEKRK